MTTHFNKWSSVPRDGTFVYAYHKVHKCFICIAYSPDMLENTECPWLEKTGCRTWPEEAFTCWKPYSEIVA